MCADNPAFFCFAK
jgi:chaperonin GroES